MNFGEALIKLRSGYKVTRKGWNEKGQYIVLGYNFTYDTFADDYKLNRKSVFHNDIGSQAIVFVGSRGDQVGWLASQADMLANDWEVVGNA